MAAWTSVVAVAVLAGCTGRAEPDPSPGSSAAGAAAGWSAPAGQTLPPGTTDAMQGALEAYLSTAGAPGATAAVVTTEGVWAGASGVDGAGVPLQPRSASAIASITKTFVAAEVLLLSARGQVDLDADVADYVELPFETEGATVRDALGMESGFPLDPIRQIFGLTADVDREWTAEDVFELAVPGTHQGTRGGTPSYNNVNFYALGLLVEEVTGERLADVLRQDLIDPAGLDRVWVQTAERPAPPLAVAASQRGIVVVDPDGPYLPSRALASAAGAAGGMVADAPTLARWGHQLYAGDLLDAQLVEQMTTAEGEGDWYGLGTMLVSTADEPVVGHEGDLGVLSQPAGGLAGQRGLCRGPCPVRAAPDLRGRPHTMGPRPDAA